MKSVALRYILYRAGLVEKKEEAVLNAASKIRQNQVNHSGSTEISDT